MKALTFALTLALATAAGTTQAAAMEHDMASHQMMAVAPTEGAGVIKELDATGERIKIAHGPINTLHWPPMTMWFAVRNPLPQNLKVGDTVRFELMQNTTDQWVIVKIERK